MFWHLTCESEPTSYGFFPRTMTQQCFDCVLLIMMRVSRCKIACLLKASRVSKWDHKDSSGRGSPLWKIVICEYPKSEKLSKSLSEYQIVKCESVELLIPCNYWNSWVRVRSISSKIVGCESNIYENIGSPIWILIVTRKSNNSSSNQPISIIFRKLTRCPYQMKWQNMEIY